MSQKDASDKLLLFKVGTFSLLLLVLIGAVTVYVNDKPFWWRSCQSVHINVADATGLRFKSPVNSLGLQIGYIQRVELFQKHVRLAICLTAPVEVLPTTRAYVESQGFLGDKYVELKPVRYTGERDENDVGEDSVNEGVGEEKTGSLWNTLFPSAHAASSSMLLPEARAAKKKANQVSSREIPVGEQSQDVQTLVKEVDTLVDELSTLTTNLRTTLNPQELQTTMTRLNLTLENASKTLSPEGNLTTTAQRALAKLEDAIEQLRDQMTRVNQGRGSVGMVLNDPQYAEQLAEALKNVNLLLGKVNAVKFIVDIGGESIPAYEDTRGWVKFGIWPSNDRYYLLGVAQDPRGKVTDTTTTTTVNNSSTTTQTRRIEETGLLFTAMLGKVLWRRVDLSLGILYNDAAASFAFNFGGAGREDRFQLRFTGYSSDGGQGNGSQMEGRASIKFFPSGSPYLKTLYIQGGIESIRKVNGRWAYAAGAGLSFDDQDIKMLFGFL